MWLNAEESRIILKEKLDSFDDTKSVKMSENINLNSEDNCLGVIVNLDTQTKNVTAILTSWNCNVERSFICSLTKTNNTTPQKLNKFPCIPEPEKSRRKRSEDNQGSKDYFHY